MKIPTEIILRPAYTNRVRPFIGKNIIKVFVGQRRVGKSYLLFQLMNELSDSDSNIIYLNLEDYEYCTLRTPDQLDSHLQSKLHDEKKNLLFIDEIQHVEGFEVVIRSLLLRENVDIYITGSNAKLLSAELATRLTGRYVEFAVHPLSYHEFLEFHKMDDTQQSLEKYCRFGGLPFLSNLTMEENVVADYLKSVYSAILFHDIAERYNIRNAMFLENLARFFADNTGSLFSAKSISDYLKSQHSSMSVNQIQAYAGYLCNAFLIRKVERYDIVGKRIFEIGGKYYFEDLGIRNAIVGYRPMDRGKLLENIVYNHLCYRGYSVWVGSLDGCEIDFLAEKGNERIYVQVALSIDSEETKLREFGNLLKISDNYPKYVVTWEGFEGNTYQGIEEMSLRKFLTEV